MGEKSAGSRRCGSRRTTFRNHRVRKRLPLEVHHGVFLQVLEIADQKKPLKGKTVVTDSTTLEANAAMKSIVLRETGENWKEYPRRLASEAGIEDPSDEDPRRFDRKRKNKKVSNKDWQSKTDRDSRIAKMKDGRTHLAYKASIAALIVSVRPTPPFEIMN